MTEKPKRPSAEPDQAKSNQAKSNQAKSNQAKSNQERVRYEVYGVPIETIIASANAASETVAAAKSQPEPEPEPAWPSLEELAAGGKPQAKRRGRRR